MATFKAIVEPHYKRRDNTYNIKIRVIHQTKKRYISTQWYVIAKDMTPKLKLKTQSYIDASEDLIREYRKQCDSLGERIKMMDVGQLVEELTSDKTPDRFDLDFVQFVKEEAAKLKKDGRDGTSLHYTTALNSFIRFAQSDKISIHNIGNANQTAPQRPISIDPLNTFRKKSLLFLCIFSFSIAALCVIN